MDKERRRAADATARRQLARPICGTQAKGGRQPTALVPLHRTYLARSCSAA